MKKIVLIFLIAMVSVYGGFNSKAFKRSVKNIPPNKLAKSIKTFKSSKSIKEITSKIDLKKLTPVDKLTKTAEAIAKKSPINNKLMGIKNPLDSMYLYAKGGDSLFKDIGDLTTKTMRINKNILQKVKTKIPGFPKITKLTGEQLLERSVKVIKASGSHGLKIVKGIGKIANDNRYSAVAGIMYAWYLADPNGFKEKLDEFGGSIQEFAKYVGSLIGETSIAGAEGFANGIATAVKEKMNLTSGLILGSIVMFWLLFKFKDSTSSQRLFARKKKTNTVVKRKKRGGRF